MTTAHEALVKNARRALENLAKDNSVSLSEVVKALKEIKDYLDGLLWDVEDEIETEWVDDFSEAEDPKYDFDDGGRK